MPDLRLTDGPLDLEAHRRDETVELAPPLPIAVAFPTSTTEVAGIVSLAAAHRVPLVPRGGGTGLSGGAAAVEGGPRRPFRAALDLGGSVTGEHGIGITKRAWLEPSRGPEFVRAMRAIKAALDPLGILNPGKVLQADLRAVV